MMDATEDSEVDLSPTLSKKVSIYYLLTLMFLEPKEMSLPVKSMKENTKSTLTLMLLDTDTVSKSNKPLNNNPCTEDLLLKTGTITLKEFSLILNVLMIPPKLTTLSLLLDTTLKVKTWLKTIG